MNEQCYKFNQVMSIVMMVVMCGLTPQMHAQDVAVGVDGTAHAKGVAILRLTFPTRGEVWRVSMYKSRDGKEFHQAGFISFSRAGLLYSTSYNEDVTTIMLPSVGWDNSNVNIAFYGNPGTYWLRWGVGFRDQDKPRTVPDQLDKNIPNIVVDQVIEVAPPTVADLDFIARLGDPDLARAMFGDDFFERQTGNAVAYYADPEHRSVKVIGRLLSATGAKWVGDVVREAGPRGDVHKAAGMLLSLAKRIPESSYAPYAAYYAGCCYMAAAANKWEAALRTQRTAGQPRDKTAETTRLVAFFRNDPDRKKAEEALALAVQRADDYLKPRALYQYAGMRAAIGAFEDAERLLTKAVAVVPGERTIQEWVASGRKDVENVRVQLEMAKRRSGGVEDSGSDKPKP